MEGASHSSSAYNVSSRREIPVEITISAKICK
jgi:hypothetical protein